MGMAGIAAEEVIRQAVRLAFAESKSAEFVKFKSVETIVEAVREKMAVRATSSPLASPSPSGRRRGGGPPLGGGRVGTVRYFGTMKLSTQSKTLQ